MSRLKQSIRRIATGTALSLPLLATAQDAADQMGERAIEQITVTATRRTESAQDIPISLTVVTAAQLAQTGAVDARDLVAITPNLATQGSFGRTAPSYFIRGIGTTQFNPNANSKVGIYIDDVYLNSTAVQGAQLFDVAQVEVARGPQGYLFGQNTTGGLIRTIVNKPVIGAGLNADVDVTYGRFDQMDVSGALGLDLTDKAALRVSATSLQSDGYEYNELLGQHVGGSDLVAGRVQLLLTPSDNLNVLVNVHASNDESELVPYKQIGLVDPNTGAACANPRLGSGCTDFFGYADTADLRRGQWDVRGQRTAVRASGDSVAINWELPAATLASVSAYEKNSSRALEDTDGSPTDAVNGSYTGDPRQFSQELRLTSRGSGSLQWLAGLYYFDEDFSGSTHFAARAFGPGVFTGVGTTLEGVGQTSAMTTHSYAGFGNIDWAFSERTKLSLGLRYTHETKAVDYDAYITDPTQIDPATLIGRSLVTQIATIQTIDFHTQQDWDNVSGRVSLDYRFSPEVLGYISFARGFNSGNFNGGAFLEQSEASLVDPETLKSYEVGIKSDLAGGTVRLNADVFYYDFTNQQVFILASTGDGPPFQQLSNAAASSLYGAEVEFTWKPLDALLLQGGTGYTHSKFDKFDSPLAGDLTGKELPSAPHWNVNLLARYEWQLAHGTIAFTADTKFMDNQFFSVTNDPLLVQPAYWITNARAAFEAPGDRWTVSLWAKNLADENYLVGAYDLAGFGFDQDAVGTPRTYGITVSYRMH